MTISDAFHCFIRSRRLKGCGDKTIDSYKNLISVFVKHIGADFLLEDISPDDLEDFVDELYSRPLSKSSVASYIRNTRIFLSWCEKKYNIKCYASELPVPRSPKKVLEPYSPDDLALIFRTISTCSEWLTARNCSMVALMYDSGIRQKEVCLLKVRDISFSDCRMKVYGKGSKERFVPIGKLSIQYLKEYLTIRPYDSEYVFLCYHGDPISPGAIKSMTWDLQQLLPFEFSSHRLRHNFATNFLLDQYEERGQIDIYQLMSVMGHESINTTRRYLHEVNNLIAVNSSISHLDKVLLGVI